MRFVSGYYLAQVALQDRRAPRRSVTTRLRRGVRRPSPSWLAALRPERATARSTQRAQASRSAS
jgi:hypothetical protein